MFNNMTILIGSNSNIDLLSDIDANFIGINDESIPDLIVADTLTIDEIKHVMCDTRYIEGFLISSSSPISLSFISQCFLLDFLSVKHKTLENNFFIKTHLYRDTPSFELFKSLNSGINFELVKDVLGIETVIDVGTLEQIRLSNPFKDQDNGYVEFGNESQYYVREYKTPSAIKTAMVGSYTNNFSESTTFIYDGIESQYSEVLINILRYFSNTIYTSHYSSLCEIEYIISNNKVLIHKIKTGLTSKMISNNFLDNEVGINIINNLKLKDV